MIDIEALVGSAIREGDKSGRIVEVSLPWVRVAWTGHPQSTLSRSDPAVFETMEILTMDRGWLPMGQLIGAKDGPRLAEGIPLRGLAEELDSLLESSDELEEDSDELSEAPQGLAARLAFFLEAKMRGSRKEGGKKPSGSGAKKAGGSGAKKKKGGDGRKHWPFKRNKTNGAGPGGDHYSREVSRKDDWRCKCSSYACKCKGPKGRIKPIKIKKDYKKRYNAKYRKEGPGPGGKKKASKE